MNATNDNDENDPLPFIRLSALVANVVAHLQRREEQQEDGGCDANSRDAGEGNSERDRADIDSGLQHRMAGRK
jgi:hypothetical protein